jgi:hypothetical protein
MSLYETRVKNAKQMQGLGGRKRADSRSFEFPVTQAARTSVGSPGTYASFLTSGFALRILHATSTAGPLLQSDDLPMSGRFWRAE